MLEIFTVHNGCAADACSMNDQGVPEGNVSQPVQFDGCNNISDFKPHDVCKGENFYSSLGPFRIKVQFARSSVEVFLRNLKRKRGGSISEMLRKNAERAVLLGR